MGLQTFWKRVGLFNPKYTSTAENTFLVKFYIEVILGQCLKTGKYQNGLKVITSHSLILSPYVMS